MTTYANYGFRFTLPPGYQTVNQHIEGDLIVWINSTHGLGFEILRSYDAIGGCCESGGTWQVDLDTGKLAAWTPPPDILTMQEGLVSPDSSQIALVGETGLILVDIDGSNRRENLLTYPYIPQIEGGGSISSNISWAPDSQSLAAITYSEDIWEENSTFTTWRVPVDGLPAHQLATFTGIPFSIYLSPNQIYLAYSRVTRPMSNDRELHIAFFDGSKDLVYAQGHLMGFWGWAPDSFHFIFGQSSTLAPLWGSVCGGSQPLLNPPVLPARQFAWVDSEHFLWVKGSYENSRAELRLGQVGGGSILIGPFNGEYAQFQFDPDKEALGGLK